MEPPISSIHKVTLGLSIPVSTMVLLGQTTLSLGKARFPDLFFLFVVGLGELLSNDKEKKVVSLPNDNEKKNDLVIRDYFNNCYQQLGHWTQGFTCEIVLTKFILVTNRQFAKFSSPPNLIN